MARNDPTDTGGLFVGRRPGTGPLRYRGTPTRGGGGRRAADRLLAAALLFLETILCVSLWGPQPIAWLWVGSQVDYQLDSVTAGICAAFAGMLFTLFLTLAIVKRLDHAWRLVRRAAGYEQREGMLNLIFVVSLLVAGSAFLIWFFIIVGPGPTVAPTN
jgi:hypothetical protein